jgi:chlorobactene glucosyltransferase
VSGFWLQHQVGICVFLGVLLLIAFSNCLALRRLAVRAMRKEWPSVSILVPMRDEERSAQACLRSLLAQDYPHFNVLVLDDGSRDGTPQILAELAKRDGRLKMVGGRPLPEGWLGKHWACQQLAETAEGQLLLFTDADTVHEPWALRQAVSVLEEHGAHLLSGLVRQEARTWGEQLIVPAAHWCVFSFFPFALVQRPELRFLAVANGQFMLFRREAYFALGGHASVCANPVDDLALARRAKEQGLRLRLADLTGHVSCRMYTSYREAAEGFSKNLFAVFGFRLLPYLFVWLWLLVVTWEPLLVLVAGQTSSVAFSRALGAAAALEMLGLWLVALWRLRLRKRLAFLYPVLMTAFAAVALRSAYEHIVHRALWKGRRIPPQRLRVV